MFDRFGDASICIGVFLSFPVPHHLRLSLRVDTLGQTRKLQWRNLTGETKGGGKFALPLSLYRVLLLVIALRIAGVLQLVISLCLGGTDGFREGEHSGLQVV